MARGPSVVLLEPPGAARTFGRDAGRGDGVPAGLVDALRRRGNDAPIIACGEWLSRALAREVRVPVRAATMEEWRDALAVAPEPDRLREREWLLREARRELEEALRSPEEILISLAREEERLERAVGRERRAAEAFVAVPGTALDDYARAWANARDRLAEHHQELLTRLEDAARTTVPNLAGLVGARVAARLVAQAGGLAPLARMPAARLQLLGARRRPGPGRGPRYGILFLTEGADDVPPDRRAAFVRSVAALAAIAARADAITHADLSARLRERRDRRAKGLRRRRP